MKIVLAFFEVPCYNTACNMHPGVAQLVARLTGGQEAVSSSLATRTKKRRRTSVLLRFFILVVDGGS